MAWRQLHQHLFSRLPSNPIPLFATYSTKSDPYPVKVGIPEFLNGIGNGVETYAEKLEAEFGDLQNLLVARSLKLKKLNIGRDPKVCKHCDLLEMPVVAQLEKNTKYGLVYHLLKIFLTKRLEAYLDFHTTNSVSLKA